MTRQAKYDTIKSIPIAITEDQRQKNVSKTWSWIGPNKAISALDAQTPSSVFSTHQSSILPRFLSNSYVLGRERVTFAGLTPTPGRKKLFAS